MIIKFNHKLYLTLQIPIANNLIYLTQYTSSIREIVEVDINEISLSPIRPNCLIVIYYSGECILISEPNSQSSQRYLNSSLFWLSNNILYNLLGSINPQL